MHQCKAFSPIAGTRMAWIPCVQKAERGSSFCRKHGNAILGAVLGALVYADPSAEIEIFGVPRAPHAAVRTIQRQLCR
jgi:hypothetical protein